jgi:hypothetical protein
MKKLFFLLFSMISFSTNLFAAADEIPKAKQTLIDKKQLAAWGQTFGNKTANLKMLKKLASQFKNVAVPDFFGISHEEMVSFLTEKNEWATISSLWSAFQNSIKDQSGLPEESKEILSKLRSIVETVDYSDLYELLTYRKLLEKKRVEKEKAFIEKAIKEKYLLMIRSTGLEDGKELSNAGGNESVASVSPDHHAISDAIKKVLSSYFSEKSIMQRIIGKDQNLRSGEPFVPALMQYMIGEGSGADANLIPRSGVIYSTEGEGNTQDLTVIQATWGHNEAVVNGLAPVDSYYVDTYLHIFPVIYRKYHRLKTINGQLEKVSNESTTINNKPLFSSSTLTKSHVLKLKHISNRLEKVYGHPVDIEFVIQGKTTFLVQVRPIETKELRPSFLDKDFFNKLAPTDSIKATMIGVGDAATQIIADRNEVIVADNIRSALKEYLAALSVNEKAKEQIKAIIVNEMAPSTSHEANQFRGQQKPVFYLENLDQINELMQNKIRFFADPQRSCLVACPEKIVPQKVIQEGWFVHPIPARVSLLPSFLDKIKLPTLQKIKPSKANNIPQLLQAIKEGSTKEAEKACDTLLALTLQTIHAKMDKEQINSRLKEELFLLAKQFSIAIEAQKATLKNRKSTDIQMLYPLTFINALLKQLPEKELIDQYSLGSLIKTDRQERQLAENIDTVPHREYLIQYQKAKEFGLTRFIKVQWKKFTKTITEEENQQFARMLHQISSLEMLPLWLNVSFVKTIDEENQKQLLFDEFAESKGFLDQCSEIKKEFQAINPAAFNDPALFKKQWASLSELLNKTVCSEGFIEDLTVSPQLGRLAALSIMQTVVDVFDNSIKALTGSTLYQKDELHVQRFKTMVDHYFFMFTQWTKIKHIQNELNTLCPYVIEYNYNLISLEQYIQQMTDLFEKSKESKNQFEPSFNVSGATLGSKADWLRNFEEEAPTLESIFSLIHQNLLVVIATLSKKEAIEKTLDLPDRLNVLIENFKKISFKSESGRVTPALVGSFFNQSKLTFLYNLAIRQHSNTFIINYDIITKKITFETTFIGHSEDQRWERIGLAAKAMSKYFDIPFSKSIEVDSTKGLLSFGYEIKTDLHASLVPHLILIFSAWTVSESLNGLPFARTSKLYTYLYCNLDTFKYLPTREIYGKLDHFQDFYNKIIEGIKNDKDAIILILDFPSFYKNISLENFINKILEYAKKTTLGKYEKEILNTFLERFMLKYEKEAPHAINDLKSITDLFNQIILKKIPLSCFKNFETRYDHKNLLTFLFTFYSEKEKFIQFLINEKNNRSIFYALSIITDLKDDDSFFEEKIITTDLLPCLFTKNAPDGIVTKGLMLWKKMIKNGLLRSTESNIFLNQIQSLPEQQIKRNAIIIAQTINNDSHNLLKKDVEKEWIVPFLIKLFKESQNNYKKQAQITKELFDLITPENISKIITLISFCHKESIAPLNDLIILLSKTELTEDQKKEFIENLDLLIKQGIKFNPYDFLNRNFSMSKIDIFLNLFKKQMIEETINFKDLTIISSFATSIIGNLSKKNIDKKDFNLIKEVCDLINEKITLNEDSSLFENLKQIRNLIEEQSTN